MLLAFVIYEGSQASPSHITLYKAQEFLYEQAYFGKHISTRVCPFKVSWENVIDCVNFYFINKYKNHYIVWLPFVLRHLGFIKQYKKLHSCNYFEQNVSASCVNHTNFRASNNISLRLWYLICYEMTYILFCGSVVGGITAHLMLGGYRSLCPSTI